MKDIKLVKGFCFGNTTIPKGTIFSAAPYGFKTGWPYQALEIQNNKEEFPTIFLRFNKSEKGVIELDESKLPEFFEINL